MDYASATPVCDAAQRAVESASHVFGNPGALHADGVEAKKLLQKSRDQIAHELAVKSRQLIFTSGGTEGNNLAILGLARHFLTRSDLVGKGGSVGAQNQGSLLGTHWVVGAIEHPSVLECFGEIERLGGEVTFVDPDSRGIISAEKVAHALRRETVLVSIQWANHEIGTVQPLREIARSIREFECSQTALMGGKSGRSILLHSDVGQAPLYLAPHLHTLGLDMATLDSGKLYGPRGIGALYLSNRVELAGLLLGGKQERGLRAGTENVALAAGFATALAHVGTIREVETRRIRALRDMLARDILATIPTAHINGDTGRALAHILNVSVPDISSEYVTLALDRMGIAISTKSACREGEESQSHVVAALGGAPWIAQNTLRFSLGEGTSSREVSRAVLCFSGAIVS